MIFHHRQNIDTFTVIDNINKALIIIFGVGIFIKAFAKGWIFLKKISGIYQILVVLMSYINWILQNFQDPNDKNQYLDEDQHIHRIFNAVAKAMQFSLIIYVLRRSPKIKQFFQAIKNIMPILWSMVGLIFLYLYVYTIIAMNIFSYLKPQFVVNGIDIHFRTFFKAM